VTARAAAVLGPLFTAPHPRRELAEQMDLFTPLIGSWDLEVTDFRPDGSRTETEGEWHFSWALAGRAVADVWICPRRSELNVEDGAVGDEWGTSIRFYDATEGLWRSTWIGPGRGLVRTFVGRPTPDGLQLTGTFAPGLETRWTFSSVTSVSFDWRNETIDVSGHVSLRQTFAARRADPARGLAVPADD
jgi:hypothetical protein